MDGPASRISLLCPRLFFCVNEACVDPLFLCTGPVAGCCMLCPWRPWCLFHSLTHSLTNPPTHALNAVPSLFLFSLLSSLLPLLHGGSVVISRKLFPRTRRDCAIHVHSRQHHVPYIDFTDSHIIPQLLLTRICHGHVRGPLVAQPPQSRGHGEQDDGAQGADDARVEVGRALAGGPAQVAEGTGPESRARAGHCGCCAAGAYVRACVMRFGACSRGGKGGVLVSCC